MTDQPIRFPTMLELAQRYGLDLVQIAARPAEWKRCCPFHGEQTPSFYVDTGAQTFRCFGCGASGDRIGFVARMEGLAFPDAVLLLQVLALGSEFPPPVKPTASPRVIQAHPPAKRLRGVAADLRDALDEREVDRDELRGLAVRIEGIARELEVKS